MELCIFGINHGFQRMQVLVRESVHFERAYKKLKSQIENLLNSGCISLLAEEYSQEALDRWGDKETLLQEISKQFEIPHQFCDPDLIQRKNENILDDKARERFWLKQLEKSDVRDGQVIFLCGYDHFESFQNLCRSHGNKVVFAERIELSSGCAM